MRDKSVVSLLSLKSAATTAMTMEFVVEIENSREVKRRRAGE